MLGPKAEHGGIKFNGGGSNFPHSLKEGYIAVARPVSGCHAHARILLPCRIPAVLHSLIYNNNLGSCAAVKEPEVRSRDVYDPLVKVSTLILSPHDTPGGATLYINAHKGNTQFI